MFNFDVEQNFATNQVIGTPCFFLSVSLDLLGCVNRTSLPLVRRTVRSTELLLII